ncbi:MAG: hypothetical protein LBL66_06650 [Clostridiales bacterium]|jgi:beta-mannosidase|nr:hypothetical protein [Clostridiales bacterium]
MKTINLNGTYRLYRFETGAPETPDGLTGLPHIPAPVPGDVEAALTGAGLLPDVYFADNVKRAEALELSDWWYAYDFQFGGEDGDGGEPYLFFEGVDTLAEYFLNGAKLGQSGNMFVGSEFAVRGFLKRGKNTLAVRIRSAIGYALNFPSYPSEIAFPGGYEGLHIRKAAHMYGWDILPRLVSAGIIGNVELRFRPKIRFEQVALSTVFAREGLAGLRFFYEAKLPPEERGRFNVVLSGVCGGSRFEFAYKAELKQAALFPYVRQPALWYPAGTGGQPLYDVKVALVDSDGKERDVRTFRFGIRRVELDRENGGFSFRVNGVPVKAKGANLAPPDALPARGAGKFRGLAALLKEANCNMARVWGGGVYGSDGFYDACDEAGILVWQDVMLACHMYPQDGDLCARVRAEVEAVARRIRNHPSLALWCGGNETDWNWFCTGGNAENDKLTRGAIPAALRAADPDRPYYESAPAFTGEYTRKHGGVFSEDLEQIERQRAELPEEHWWWSRGDYRKFAAVTHKFIGETGYSGMPPLSSIQKFMPPGEERPSPDNPHWAAHLFPTDPSWDAPAKNYFGEVPFNTEDLILATQIAQAEAYKFIAERMRTDGNRTGVLFWTLNEAWPEYTSGMADYYGRRKLAFHYVKQSFAPRQTVMTEDTESGELRIIVLNDGLDPVSGDYTAKNERGEIVARGIFSVEGNSATAVAALGKGAGRYFYLYADFGGETVFNHFMPLAAPRDFKGYREHLKRVLARDGLTENDFIL